MATALKERVAFTHNLRKIGAIELVDDEHTWPTAIGLVHDLNLPKKHQARR